MKAEERHQLKTNELPEFLKKHLTTIIACAVTFLLAIFIAPWAVNMWKDSNRIKNSQLQRILVNRSIEQTRLVNQAQTAMQDPESTDVGAEYNNVPIITELTNLAGGANEAVNITVAIQQAQTILSELYYSQEDISGERKSEICKKADDLFQQIESNSASNVAATAQAKLGRAMIAEELNQWDRAQSIYNEIVVDKDGKYANTMFATLAQQRLDIMDDLKEIVVFPPAPPAPPVEPEISTESPQPAPVVITTPKTESGPGPAKPDGDSIPEVKTETKPAEPVTPAKPVAEPKAENPVVAKPAADAEVNEAAVEPKTESK